MTVAVYVTVMSPMDFVIVAVTFLVELHCVQVKVAKAEEVPFQVHTGSP